jgi:hypothetical protein
MYPIDLYLFREGLFIRDASPQHPDLIGCRVLRIGPRSTELALAAARPLCSVDNEMGYRFEAPLLLVQPSVARELSLSDPSGKLPLTILDPQGIERQVLLEPGSPLGGNPFQWLAGRGNPESTEPLPRYLAGVTEPFWYEWVEDQRLVYFQWNAIEETSSRNFADFCAELFDSIERNNAEVLVIDLRHNGGGNNQLLKPFMHGLIRCDRINRPDRLFAIVGRRTASAAMNAAAMLEQESQAIIVGEPTGSSPNHVGEPVVLQLPCTKTQVFISTLFWQNSTAGDGRTWIAPRIVAEPTWAAHQANRDPAMDAICQYMATVGV